MKKLVTVALAAATLLALAVPAKAAPYSTHQEGRTERRSFQLGNADLGEVHNVLAGNFREDLDATLPDVDPDAFDDDLYGGDKFTKVRHALRIQVNTVKLQVRCADGSWATLRADLTANNSGVNPYVIANTPRVQLVESGSEFAQLYRVQSSLSVRWANTGRLSTWTETSRAFFDQAFIGESPCLPA